MGDSGAEVKSASAADAIGATEAQTSEDSQESSATAALAVESAPEEAAFAAASEPAGVSQSEEAEAAEEEEDTESAPCAVAMATEPSGGEDGASSKLDSGYNSAQQGVATDACKVCQKRVYPMEMLLTDGKIYHKTCYRCHKCHRQLGVGNFAIMENQLYCQPHYLELFMLKGSYSVNGSAGTPVNAAANNGAEEAAPDCEGDDASGQQQQQHAPKLSNIKSKFESFEEQPPASPSKRKEKVYYAGLQSAKHRYETATSEKEKPHSEKPKRFTPPREGSAGIVESQPQDLPPDVVRYYDNNGDSDDRPAPGSSRGALARFKEMEQQHQNGSHQPPAKDATATRPRSPHHLGGSNFDYTAPVSDATVSESNPAPPADDVIRSGGPHPADELPPANATRSALQIWRQKEGPTVAMPPNPEASERQRELAARERQQAGQNRNVRLPQQQQQPA